jgi:hypothetical protein
MTTDRKRGSDDLIDKIDKHIFLMRIAAFDRSHTIEDQD